MMQERIKQDYPSIKLPEDYQEENRGFPDCCEPELVLASTTDTDTFKNDVKSAWIKLAESTDTCEFILERLDGGTVTYVPTAVPFVNEDNAFYTTIPWRDVLIADGIGCYKISINYEISGLTGTIVWGTYNLLPFSIENALYTCRVRVFFNLNQTIEGINFTGSNVECSFRVKGQIDKDQPNNEYETLIYGTRRVETVVNENKPTYKLETDGYTDETLLQLETLYLLSANECFISDHNAHSNSYRIKDIPVIVKESPEREKIARFGRDMKITCIFEDRVQNKRTHY